MKPIFNMQGNKKDLKTLAGIICNRVRIDSGNNDIVHLLMDGYSDNNLHAVERWLHCELRASYQENEPLNVAELSDRLLQQLVDAKTTALYTYTQI